MRITDGLASCGLENLLRQCHLKSDRADPSRAHAHELLNTPQLFYLEVSTLTGNFCTFSTAISKICRGHSFYSHAFQIYSVYMCHAELLTWENMIVEGAVRSFGIFIVL